MLGVLRRRRLCGPAPPRVHFPGKDRFSPHTHLLFVCTAIMLTWRVQRYPWVEWGVLFRDDKEGQPRFASSAWVDDLVEVNRTTPMQVRTARSPWRVRAACYLRAGCVQLRLRTGAGNLLCMPVSVMCMTCAATFQLAGHLCSKAVQDLLAGGICIISPPTVSIWPAPHQPSPYTVRT